MPLTTPVRETEACMLVAKKIPPAAVSATVMESPMQTADGPVMAPACGAGFTVTGCMATSVPQLLVTEYLTVSRPASTPVTTPKDEMVTCPLLLQLPPLAASARIIVAPSHTLPGPTMVSASGAGFT